MMGRMSTGVTVGRFFSGDPAVADPRLGEHHARIGRVVAELLTQLADVHAEVVALGPVPRTPYLAQQEFVCEQLPGMAHEELQERELGPGQVDRLTAAGHPAP